MQDGIDHINVYSKGLTSLGRKLSNFARTPFAIDGKKFDSVEAWWFWHKTGNCLPKNLSKFNAKPRKSMPVINYDQVKPEELLRVYQAKADQTPGLKAALLANNLPFDHYYVLDGQRKDTPHRWTGQLWDQVIYQYQHK